MHLNIYLEQDNDTLPNTADTREAFTEIGLAVDGNKLLGYGFACPEAFDRSRTHGYVFVGGGLTAAMIRANRPLLLFCPSSSHRGKNALAIVGLFADSFSNSEVIALLESALLSGTEGLIPYSEKAMAAMRAELAARKAIRQD